MHWQLILEEFRPNIQHIAGVEKILSDMLSRLSSTSFDKYEPSTIKSKCRANELFEIGREEKKIPPR